MKKVFFTELYCFSYVVAKAPIVEYNPEKIWPRIAGPNK